MIRAHGLGKSYGTRVALEDVSFDLPSGSVTAVVGANGAGKSTLLRCLAGLARHEGSVTLEGPIGYLPQSASLPPGASVGEVRALLASLGRGSAVPPSEMDDRRVGHLSGGQQQRAALAAVFGLAPRTLLLDEPTANLDDTARAELFATLAGLAQGGVTVLLTTPAPEAGAVDRRVDHVVTLSRGRLVSVT